MQDVDRDRLVQQVGPAQANVGCDQPQARQAEGGSQQPVGWELFVVHNLVVGLTLIAVTEYRTELPVSEEGVVHEIDAAREMRCGG